MPKIITVTANTAIDWILRVNRGYQNQHSHVQDSQKFAAGKGINVAKTIAALNCPVIAMGFVGQQSANIFTAIQTNKLTTAYTFVSGTSRTNITLHEAETHAETHLSTTGFKVNQAACKNLSTQLATILQKNDLVILSGSLPLGASNDFYSNLIKICQQKQALVFLDSSGTALKQAIAAKPFLIKPNKNELEQLMDTKLLNDDAIIKSATELVNQGIQWVVVSRGKQGLIAVHKQQVFILPTPKITASIISTVGCGDALIAGLALAYTQKKSAIEMLNFALACSVANLFSAEAGNIDPQQQAQIHQQISL